MRLHHTTSSEHLQWSRGQPQEFTIYPHYHATPPRPRLSTVLNSTIFHILCPDSRPFSLTRTSSIMYHPFRGPDETAMTLPWSIDSGMDRTIILCSFLSLCMYLGTLFYHCEQGQISPVPARLDVQRTPAMICILVAGVRWSSMVGGCLSAPARSRCPHISTVIRSRCLKCVPQMALGQYIEHRCYASTRTLEDVTMVYSKDLFSPVPR